MLKECTMLKTMVWSILMQTTLGLVKFVFGHPPRADEDDPVYRMEDEHAFLIARHAKT